MSEPFVGEIRPVAFNFAPENWALCNGQTLSISENQTLFALIGTTYGGDGQTTFQLPDLQCRVAMHAGGGFVEGQKSGVESVTLTTQQIPAHSHPVPSQSDTTGASASPAGAHFGASTQKQYAAAATGDAAATVIQSAGGTQPHDNMPPFLTINYIISLFGVFPSRA